MKAFYVKFLFFTALLCVHILISYELRSSPEKIKDNDEVNLRYNNTEDKIEQYEDNVNNKLTFINTIFMDSEHNYLLQWDFNETHIIFEVQVKTLGWIVLGFSSNEKLTNSDIAIMWIKKGKLILQDYFASASFDPVMDKINNLIPLYGYENKTHTVVAFTRLLDTCDNEMDQKFAENTLYAFYDYHTVDPIDDKLMKRKPRGFKRLFLMSLKSKPELALYTKKLSFRAKNYKVPFDVKTTYRCFIRKINGINKKYQLIKTIPEIDPELIHHMVLHICDSSFKNSNKLKDFNCYSDKTISIMAKCFTTILDVWAAGGESYDYPPDVGFPVTPDMNGRYVIVEIHYNNYALKKGIIDNSGFTVYLTDKIRKHDANIFGVGLTTFDWGIMIPPKQKEFQVNAICSPTCSNNVEMPDDGINLFSYIFHTHLIGRKLRFRLIRDGQEIASLVDDNYNFDYQIKRTLKTPLNVRKNDSLILECIYSSEDRDNYTFGGLSTQDEMCLVVFWYYPKTEFTVCGSLPNRKALAKLLHLKNTQMEKASTLELFTFSLKENNKKILNIVSDQVNTPKGKSQTQIEKLQDFYKTQNVISLCRFMSLPAIKTVPMPIYKPFIKNSTQCLNS